MITGFRDVLALPLMPTRRPSMAWAYIHIVDGAEFDDSRLDGYVDGLEAYRQAVFHMVHTERYDYPGIHPGNEGIRMRQFVGRSFAYFRAKIYNVVKDALFQDDRTRGVRLTQTANPQPGVAFAEFEIDSAYGRVRYGFNVPLME